MEVVDTRLANFQQADPEWLLADNQMNHALVVGDAIANWKSLDWANLPVRLVIDGNVVVDQTGGLGAVDPVRPLAWMIDHAVRRRGGARGRPSPRGRGPAFATSRREPAHAANSRHWDLSKRPSST
jgi:hypothetical protein